MDVFVTDILLPFTVIKTLNAVGIQQTTMDKGNLNQTFPFLLVIYMYN